MTFGARSRSGIFREILGHEHITTTEDELSELWRKAPHIRIGNWCLTVLVPNAHVERVVGVVAVEPSGVSLTLVAVHEVARDLLAKGETAFL